MPILEVEIVTREGIKFDSSLAQKLVDAAGTAFGSSSGRVWVKLRTLAKENYAENGGASDILPVFVSVLMKQHKFTDLSSTASNLAAAFGKVLDRPEENIHILFQPECAGRIAFGGKL